MKLAIVTGADGFLGRHLTKYLAENGYEVYAFVYPSANVFKKVAWGGINNIYTIACDLNNIFDYSEVIPDGIDVMFLLAWNGVCPEMRSDMDAQLENISLTLKCMEFAQSKGIKRVVFPGSTNEYMYYGKALNDDAVPSPVDAYGSVKVALRYLCQQYSLQNDICFVYTIIASIYAADRTDNNVIYYTIRSLLDGKSPSITKCDQVWDYVYIDDVIEALTLVGECGKDRVVYSIGHGDNWPLKHYINIIHQLVAPEIRVGFGEKPYASAALPSAISDLANIERDTGFLPRVSFEDGISKVIATVKQQREVTEHG